MVPRICLRCLSLLHLAGVATTSVLRRGCARRRRLRLGVLRDDGRVGVPDLLRHRNAENLLALRPVAADVQVHLQVIRNTAQYRQQMLDLQPQPPATLLDPTLASAARSSGLRTRTDHVSLKSRLNNYLRCWSMPTLQSRGGRIPSVRPICVATTLLMSFTCAQLQ